MKITKENLELEQALTKEWIITNGIGGFASSTIIGANTRKYHGLLIAPISPPAMRFLILSKVDESIIINNKIHNIYTNICENYISDGYKNQTSFEKAYFPIFKYKIEDIEITKTICMEYEKNTVAIYYKIKNKNQKVKLQLAPIVNFRDFHTVNKNEIVNLKQQINGNKVKIIIDDKSSFPLYMKISEGNYIKHYNNVFKNMFYIEEQKRGFDPKENHAVTGVFEVEIEPNEEKEISFIFSFEENIDEINAKELIEKEIIRLNKIFNNSLLIDNRKIKKEKAEIEKDEEIRKYLIAADNFIVYRPTFGYHTIIAGYPWFLDWGRDSLIAYEGLLLIPKRFKEAKEVLLTLTRDIKKGLVPNGYSGFDNRPLYNSVDASLMLFEQIKKYIEYTNDYQFIQNYLYKKLETILENYKKGIDVDNNNIYLDKDNLIVSGTKDTQNTWMDVKIGNYAVTPRNGKTVEINSLWYNALLIMSELSQKFQEKEKAKKYKELAKKCKKSFNEKFYNEKRKSLYDVIGDDKIRPNQLFSMSLTYQIIDVKTQIAKNILKTVEKELLNNYGLQTLSNKDNGYIDIYEGDEYKRDTAYHQGITWPWLLGLYYNTLKNMKNNMKTKKEQQEIEEKIMKFRKKIQKTFKEEIDNNGCIGSIAEIYDTKKPQLPKGAIAQAWSISEVFRIYLGK